MGKFSIYLKKSFKFYYFLLDKVSKKKYRKSYPKYLNRLGINIDYKDIGDTWISPTVFFDSSGWTNIYIGKDVVISFDVAILTHDGSIVNAARFIEPQVHMKELINNKVQIGNNVFIGARTIILPGTYIGDNVIIGAGSVVKGKIESGFVYCGTPAIKKCSVEKFYEKYNYLEREHKK